jgi:hypothetical protein
MQKKILCIFLGIIFSTLSAFADKIPSTSKSIKNYGIGLIKLDRDFDIYSNPQKSGKIIQHVNLPEKKKNSAIIEDYRGNSNPFVIVVPEEKEYFATVEEYPENGWIKIYTNQQTSQTGWIKNEKENNFLTWKEFIFEYGRENGLRLMTDVKSEDFKLYAQDTEEAKIADRFSYPEFILLRLIRGNWALVTIIDTGTVYKTGWIKWREDNGAMKLFPKMKR